MGIYAIRRIRVPAFKWCRILNSDCGSLEKLAAQVTLKRLLKCCSIVTELLNVLSMFFPHTLVSDQQSKREKIISLFVL